MAPTTTDNPPQLLPDRTLPVPGWLPEERRRRLSGNRVRVRIRRGVRSRLRTLPRIPVSEWSERHRVMPSAESFEGKWRREFAPHAVRIMDTWALPWVREAWFCGPDQASKTNTMLSCLGWSIERDPGNFFYTMQDEKKAKEIMSDKLIPMLQLSPPLRRLISPRADDTTVGKIRLANGVHGRAAWASSAGSTATFSAKHTYNDEVDKWEDHGKETDAVRRIRKRAKNFPLDHKHFFCSTPAGRYIYKGMTACRQVLAYAGRCPHCGELILMDEEHFVIPQGWGKEEIQADPEAIAYACNACGAEWSEYDRKDAYEQGDWIYLKGEDVARPETVGFHLSGFITPDMRMAAIAVTIAEARAGDLSAKKDLAHGIKCVDYEETLAAREDSAILLLRDERAVAELPSEPIAAISCVADMQKRGFWYKVTAWGYGIEQESWLLQAGFLDSWEALRRMMFESEFTDPRGGKHVVTLRGMDSGGGESGESDLSRTAEAYLFAYQNPGVLLFKGKQQMSAPFRVSDLDKIPGTNRALPGGLKLFTLNATHFKDRLAAKLLVSPSDPGAWHLHSGYDLGQLDLLRADPSARIDHGLHDFARQMCAEGKDERGYWQNPKNKPNHLWDCSYMELALVDIHQVKLWPRPGGAPAPPKESTVKREINKRRRW